MTPRKKLPLTLALLCSIGVFTTACGGSSSEPPNTPTPPTGNTGGDTDNGGDNTDDGDAVDDQPDDNDEDDAPDEDQPSDDETGEGEEPEDDTPDEDAPSDDGGSSDDEDPEDDEDEDAGDPGGVPDQAGDPSLPLSEWTWVYPQPMGYSLNDIIADSTGFIAVGSRGAVLSSSDGENWHVQHVGGATLRAITFDGARYVAVGGDAGDTTGGVIFYSDDGETWNRAAQGLQIGSLEAVTWTGNDFIALGRESGAQLRSSDGETWERIASGPDTGTLALASDGPTLVAGGVNAIFRSLDGGHSWSQTLSTDNTAGGFNSLLFDGEQFATAGSVNVGGFRTSTDGSTWSADPADKDYADSLAGSTFTAIIRTGDHYWLSHSGGRVHRRAVDAATWSVQSGELASELRGIAHLEGTFVTLGTTGALARSQNGNDWDNLQTRSMPAGNDLRTLTTNDQGRLVAAGRQNHLYYSDDGDSWTAASLDSGPYFINAATWTGEYYIVVGLNRIAHSTGGDSWTNNSGFGDDEFFAVAGSGEHWVALGNNLLVRCELSLCEELDTDLGELRQIIHDGEQYWTINGEGHVYTSADGHDWKDAGRPLTQDARLLAAAGNTLVAATNSQTQNNVRFTTDGGATWQAATFPGGAQVTGRSLYSDGESFLLHDNTRGTLWHSSDGANWNAERMPHSIEALVRAGEQLYIVTSEGYILRQ